MKSRRCCERCKRLHLKCLLDSKRLACTRCNESGSECVLTSTIRFRPTSYVDTFSGGFRTRTHLTYSRDQIWVGSYTPKSFVFEDGSGAEFIADSSHVLDEQLPVSLPNAICADGLSEERDQPTRIVSGDGSNTGHDTFADAGLDFVPIYTNTLGHSQERQHGISHSGHTNPSPDVDHRSPASINELTRRYTDEPVWNAASPSHLAEYTSPFSTVSHSTTRFDANLSLREAFLIRHYISKIAPWIDACDLTNQFTLEVPKRALRMPLMLYAILALSSRHQSIVSNHHNEHEAAFYQSRCLNRVIDALSSAPTTYDDNLFATVVLLRVYEEIEHWTDRQFHLRGMGRLLVTIPEFAHSGGLAEAASWQALRQDIQVALISNQEPTFVLEHYDRSHASAFGDDAACANTIILLFAKILRQTHSTSADQIESEWARLDAQVEHWNERRLELFKPIFEEALDLQNNRPCPTIWLLNAPQVVALQYYSACKIFLSMYRPSVQQGIGFHAAKQRRVIEKSATAHLCTIIGLAESNPAVENANFTAHHLLRTCGYCITNSLQRTHALRFLEQVERLMGWSTIDTCRLLQSEWDDLDNQGE